MKFLLSVTMSVLFLASCNSAEEGLIPTGNSVGVTIQSSAYTNDGSTALMNSPILQFLQNHVLVPTAFAASVTDFRFCVTKMKVVTSVDLLPPVSTEAILGLIDISNPLVDTLWGEVNLPEGASISEVHFEVHSDSENCQGENYSVRYNGQSLTKDLEFKFKFEPAINVNNGDTINLGLNEIAKAMEDASSAGSFNNENIGNYLQVNTIGTGEKL